MPEKFRSYTPEEPRAKGTWVMPLWMERYRMHFVNTGGNTVEELMNSHVNFSTNMPLALLHECILSQVALLKRLHQVGLIS